MDLREIGKAIRSARQAKGMTQEALAARAGVSRATVNGLERGAVRELGFHKVEGILKAVGLGLAAAPASGKRSAGVASYFPSFAPGAGGFGSRRSLLRKLAQRYIWWQRPEEALRDPRRVIAQAMDAGTLEDMQRLAAAVGTQELTDILSHARPGWFRPKSWAFWHTALGVSRGGAVPPVPVRRTDDLPDPA